MGRIRIVRIKYLFYVLIFTSVFAGCKGDTSNNLADLQRNQEQYIKENIKLEKESHLRFVEELNKDKVAYFSEKTDKFIEEYDSFGFFNTIDRKWFKSDEENRREISQSLHLAFNLIDYQTFEQKKIDNYIQMLQTNRNQFELGEKEYYKKVNTIDWHNGTILKSFKRGSSQIVSDIENDTVNEVINLGIMIWDVVEILCFIIAVICIALTIPALAGGPFAALPAGGSILFFILGFGLKMYCENSRSNVIKESIMSFVEEDLLFSEGNGLLEALNENTEKYYLSGRDLQDRDVYDIMRGEDYMEEEIIEEEEFSSYDYSDDAYTEGEEHNQEIIKVVKAEKYDDEI